MQLVGNRAFTLIELLVVITVIGILATGATAVYITQIQKARDTTRINDIKAIQSAVEQSYQDLSEYPATDELHAQIAKYLQSFPTDTKHGATCANVTAPTQTYCGYIYNTGTDTNGVDLGSYELSIAFENSSNTLTKGAPEADNGDDTNRLEIGLLTDGATGQIDTSSTTGPAGTDIQGVCTLAGQNPTASDPVVINGKDSSTPAGDGCAA